MAIQIRAPEPGDLDVLAKKMHTMPLFSSETNGDYAELSQEWKKGLVRGNDLLFCYVDGVPAGMCWFLRYGTFYKGAYLQLIAVEPAQQGKGLGRALLEAYESTCRYAAGGFFILTREENEAAQKFYTRQGYLKAGELPGHAEAGKTDYIYWKASLKEI